MIEWKCWLLLILMIGWWRSTQILSSSLSTACSFAFLVSIVNCSWWIGMRHASWRWRFFIRSSWWCSTYNVDCVCHIITTTCLMTMTLHLLRSQIIADDESLGWIHFTWMWLWSIGRCELLTLMRTTSSCPRSVRHLICCWAMSTTLHIIVNSFIT